MVIALIEGVPPPHVQLLGGALVIGAVTFVSLPGRAKLIASRPELRRPRRWIDAAGVCGRFTDAEAQAKTHFPIARTFHAQEAHTSG